MDWSRGAKRQKTPNEIALTILLAALTVIFLVVCVTLMPFGIYSQVAFSITVLVALLVCLIPTTIGGLLSAIGIAGIDRLVQKNVLAMSGRAVEAAGDVDVPALGQDRHDHDGQSSGGGIYACARCGNEGYAGRGPTRRRWPTKRRRGAASWFWPRRKVSAEGRWRIFPMRSSFPSRRKRAMSGVDLGSVQYRKGAC